MKYNDSFIFGKDPEPTWFQDMITNKEAYIKTVGMHLVCHVKTKSQDFQIRYGDTLNLTETGSFTVKPLEAL